MHYSFLLNFEDHSLSFILFLMASYVNSV